MRERQRRGVCPQMKKMTQMRKKRREVSALLLFLLFFICVIYILCGSTVLTRWRVAQSGEMTSP
jgi:hypothetical protein